MDYREIFNTQLSDRFDERERNSIWRILQEDLFRANGYARFEKTISELKANIPVQYITEVEYFYKHKFYVNPAVLIPRPETEELVEWVLSDHDEHRLNVLDLGSGSGCIAITLKLARRQWNVKGMELSKAALAVAQKNDQILNARVEWIAGDMTKVASYPSDLNVIVCNPPYVRRKDQHMMTESVPANEPHLALFAPDDDALYFYREVIRHGLHVSPDVEFYFEIHHELADEMTALCAKFELAEIELREDLQGNARMLKASKGNL